MIAWSKTLSRVVFFAFWALVVIDQVPTSEPCAAEFEAVNERVFSATLNSGPKEADGRQRRRDAPHSLWLQNRVRRPLCCSHTMVARTCRMRNLPKRSLRMNLRLQSMANGGSSYYPPGADQSSTPPMQVWCDQGDLEAYAKLLAVNVNTNESEPLIIGYNGRNFSGLNDVRQHPETGDLWFTDPEYGYIQDLRAKPQLPRHIYRFEPSTGVVQVLDDGFVQLNGIEFSSDYKTLYVSDTGAQEEELDRSRPATIYAYDIIDNKRIANKRLFAFADSGIPDGVHTDTDGNVWAGCGDGVHIWNPEGILLGKIYLGETSNNFAFAPGKVFVFANSRLWVVEGINALGREVCKDFGVDSDARCSKRRVMDNNAFSMVSSLKYLNAPPHQR